MFIGIDLGTSGVKALLIDEGQTVLGSGTAPLAVSRPSAGWSEQDPQDWIDATRTALQSLAADQALFDVRAIGLSGQMHGATLLDAADTVLRPAILWNDTRSHVEAAAMDADPQFRSKTGNIVFPGFTAPKLAWVKQHEPQIFAKVDKVLLPKDYLRWWLTGDYVSEMSDASGTSWLNPADRDWSESLLAATGLEQSQMPRLVEGCGVSGGLRSALAIEFGLPAGIPIAGGGGDNAASAIGVGVTEPGDAFISLGTSGVLFAATDGYTPDPESALHTFCHALPGRWHQMGVILSATDSLSWFANLVGQSPEALTAELGDSLHPPGRAAFLPYLGGERTPHNDARVRASLIGLDHATDRAAATRAVLEGVAFAFRDCHVAMQNTGVTLSKLVAVGGGSRSNYWLQLIASTLNLPIAVPEDGEFGAAFGAARLAMIAAGEPAEAVIKTPSIKRVIEPDAALNGEFDAAYRRYRALYAALKELS